MTDADIVREALRRLLTQDSWERPYVDAASDALDRLEALSRVHVTQASHDLLVAEGWRDPAQVLRLVNALNEALDIIVWMSGSPSFGETGEAHEGWKKTRDRLDALFALASGGVRGGEEQRT